MWTKIDEYCLGNCISLKFRLLITWQGGGADERTDWPTEGRRDGRSEENRGELVSYFSYFSLAFVSVFQDFSPDNRSRIILVSDKVHFQFQIRFSFNLHQEPTVIISDKILHLFAFVFAQIHRPFHYLVYLSPCHTIVQDSLMSQHCSFPFPWAREWVGERCERTSE